MSCNIWYVFQSSLVFVVRDVFLCFKLYPLDPSPLSPIFLPLVSPFLYCILVFALRLLYSCHLFWNHYLIFFYCQKPLCKQFAHFGGFVFSIHIFIFIFSFICFPSLLYFYFGHWDKNSYFHSYDTFFAIFSSDIETKIHISYIYYFFSYFFGSDMTLK